MNHYRSAPRQVFAEAKEARQGGEFGVAANQYQPIIAEAYPAAGDVVLRAVVDPDGLLSRQPARKVEHDCVAELVDPSFSVQDELLVEDVVRPFSPTVASPALATDLKRTNQESSTRCSLLNSGRRNR